MSTQCANHLPSLLSSKENPITEERPDGVSNKPMAALATVVDPYSAVEIPFTATATTTTHTQRAVLHVEEKRQVPAVKLLQDIFVQARERKASDIHIEPRERDWRIRLRIDGQLHEILCPPMYLQEPLMTRIKVLSHLDIAQRRVPQDGRLKLNTGLHAGMEKWEEYRVSALPTVFGEKLVLRRLDTLPAALDLDQLGFESPQRTALTQALASTHGMILVTGPTGSGKTRSLYCFLQALNQESRNVCAVEDPAEIQLAGVTQVSVCEKAGLTFANTLRAFLRQDPDVIMVGEIRDAETADIAIKAAQTGHLVLSTLHTNDAPSAITRLLDIGIAAFNLACAIRMITAQRLVRKLCLACRAPVQYSAASLRAAGYTAQNLPQAPLYRAVGCSVCYGTGYQGRVGIHQVMPVSAAMREIIMARGGTQALSQQAKKEKVATLRNAGLQKVTAGITSLEEVLTNTEHAHDEYF